MLIMIALQMFTFLGLNEKQCAQILNEGHIYLTSNSRISMAGLTTKK
jgi:aspartate aminotransferase